MRSESKDELTRLDARFHEILASSAERAENAGATRGWAGSPPRRN